MGWDGDAWDGDGMGSGQMVREWDRKSYFYYKAHADMYRCKIFFLHTL